MELIKTEMTPMERSAAYARGERVDRIPCTLTAGETASPLFGIDISDYYFSSELMVEVESRLVEETGADNLGMGLGLRTIAEALGTKMAYSKYDVAKVDVPVFKSPHDVDGRELVDIHKDGRIPIMLEAFKVLKEKYGDERKIGTGSAGPLTIAGNSIGTTKLLKAMIKDPEGAKKLINFCADVVIKVAKDLWDEYGISFSFAEPLASKNLLSKEMFDEFCLPYLQKCITAVSSWQGGCSLHICGETKDRWDDVVNMGISGFWIDNCESLGELKDLYGERISMTGSIPPVDVVLYGTPETINESVKNILLEASDNPKGFCLCPGCTTPVSTSLDNMKAIMNAAATYGRGAVKGQLPEGLKGYV